MVVIVIQVVVVIVAGLVMEPHRHMRADARTGKDMQGHAMTLSA